ncbi:MAG: hypothetical protein A3E78_05275 [Alphaproteobacteria bacterium RIFCSPHIGHO2_12_FULL_63_12]|nr:MAG: hypothetical protein A3E78_05275 [Alphaproteobacteria bacterium RIFCSPHIGHO2_12_FULL_63_12]
MTLPEPPYYAVIFSSRRASGDDDGYAEMSEKMAALAASMPGYLGVDSARGSDGFGITVSYWDSEEAIANWKRNADHLAAQRLGREKWYEDYETRVARVERAYRMNRGA